MSHEGTQAHDRARLGRLANAARASRRTYLDDVEARDVEIARQDSAGVPLREIARDAGLSPGHTQRIILTQTAARQTQPPSPSSSTAPGR